MEKNKVKQVTDNLSKYNYSNKDSYITVTEWANEDGVDISIDDQIYSFSYCVLEAIDYLIKVLQYGFDEK